MGTRPPVFWAPSCRVTAASGTASAVAPRERRRGCSPKEMRAVGAPWAAGGRSADSAMVVSGGPPHRSEGIGNEGGGTLAVQVAAGAHLLQKRGDGESDDDDADDGHPDEQDGGDGRPEEREPHPGERRPHIAAVGHERNAVEQGSRACAGRRREQRDDAEQRHEDEREAQRDAQRHALRLHAVQNGAANGDEEEGHDVAAHAEDDMERLRKEVGHDGPGRSRGRDEQHNAQNDEADAHDVAARAVVQDAGLGLNGAAAGRGGFARAALRQVP